MSLRMRRMVPSDLAAVADLAREQNQRDGTSYPVPQVFDEDADGRAVPHPNTPLALVTERDGVIRQGHVFVRTVELMSFGTDPRCTAYSMRQMGPVFYLLSEKGYFDLHVQVPKQRVDGMGNSLAKAMGLIRDDDRLAHFYRELKKEREA